MHYKSINDKSYNCSGIVSNVSMLDGISVFIEQSTTMHIYYI